MLDIGFGIDIEYDKAAIEYFYAYYQFIVGMCKTAIVHNLINQEIVGYCK